MQDALDEIHRNTASSTGNITGGRQSKLSKGLEPDCVPIPADSTVRSDGRTPFLLGLILGFLVGMGFGALILASYR